MIAIGMSIALVIGWFGRRAYDLAMMQYQHDEHEKEKKFMWDELRRLRMYMADHVGKTDCAAGKTLLVDPGVGVSN